MPSVRLNLRPDVLQMDGASITISISIPEFERAESTAVGLEFPQPLNIQALIDTGASVTVINPEVVQHCKLQQRGFALIAAAGSSGRYPTHPARIEFPGTALKTLDTIRVVSLKIVRQPVACLIGRDILRYWQLLYDGPKGSVSIT